MQRRAASDQIDDADQRTARRSAFEIDDFVFMAGAEIDRLADLFVKFLHEWQGDFAHVDARFDYAAEFQQADAEAIGAGILTFDKAGVALMAARMRCAVDGCKFGGLGQLFQARRVRSTLARASSSDIMRSMT